MYKTVILNNLIVTENIEDKNTRTNDFSRKNIHLHLHILSPNRACMVRPTISMRQKRHGHACAQTIGDNFTLICSYIMILCKVILSV